MGICRIKVMHWLATSCSAQLFKIRQTTQKTVEQTEQNKSLIYKTFLTWFCSCSILHIEHA
jgi:hypothetical protein